MTRFVSDPVRVLGAAVALGGLLASACGGGSSGSSGPGAEQAQAIDGYIVGATVFCDDAMRGTTAAAGRFSCPAGTQLFRISGGQDVGFDENATTGGEVFVGELRGPATLDFVTPLSTLAVAISSTNGVYDPANFATSVETVGKSLNFDGKLDLSVNPAELNNLKYSKLNAQVNNVIKEFASTTEDYSLVMNTFAASLKAANDTGATVSLSENLTETLSRLNVELAKVKPALGKDQAGINAAVTSVQDLNRAVEEARDLDGTQKTGSNPALTVDRNLIEVTFRNETGVENTYSLTEFESSTPTGELYNVSVGKQVAAVGIEKAGLTINTTLNEAKIQLGFKLEAVGTGDARVLSVATSDARLSMTEGNVGSMVIKVPQSSTMNVNATELDGTETDATFKVNGEKTFSSGNDFVKIDLDDIEKRLADQDIDGFFDSDGNYKVTMIVGGLRINQKNGDNLTSPKAFSIDAGGQSVTGEGFQGYASFR